MDTTDPDIKFNNEGICNYCLKYDLNIKKYVYGDEKGGKRLRNLIKEIKLRGQHKEYDCVIGVSGGVDSTYVAYLVKKLQQQLLNKEDCFRFHLFQNNYDFF